MSGNSNSLLLPFSLPKDQQCKGHENFASWETYMITHGAPRGLVNYWENKVTIPNDPSSTQAIVPPVTTVSPSTPTATTFSTPIPTPLHSLTPNFLEYQLRKSVAMSLILINLIDIPGTRVNPRGKSHEAWKLLLDQYGKPSERTRNMRERDLDECKYVEGTKVASEGGHIERMRMLRKLTNDAGANFMI
jgi:hypothetical protein